jgi:hypothetical protein
MVVSLHLRLLPEGHSSFWDLGSRLAMLVKLPHTINGSAISVARLRPIPRRHITSEENPFTCVLPNNTNACPALAFQRHHAFQPHSW